MSDGSIEEALKITRLFQSARKSVDVCVFTITDDRIKDAIVEQKQILTGSYHWTRSAERYNEENFIITNDVE